MGQLCDKPPIEIHTENKSHCPHVCCDQNSEKCTFYCCIVIAGNAKLPKPSPSNDYRGSIAANAPRNDIIEITATIDK